MNAPAGLRVIVVLLGGAVAACEGSSVGDAGCQSPFRLEIPGTPLTLLPSVQLLASNDGGVVLAGVAGDVARWMTVAADGTLGAEQEIPLPEGANFPAFALAGSDATTLDTVLVGFVSASADGADGELHFISAPLDGSPPSAPGPAALTFPGMPAGPSRFVLGTPKARPASSPQQVMSAAVAFVDPAPAVKLALVDNHGARFGEPILVEGVQPMDCLAITTDTIDPDASFAVTFQRPSAVIGTPAFEQGEVWVDGGVRTLTATVAEAGRSMGCALGTPTSRQDYSFAWQDSSGSWLSVVSGRTIDGDGNLGSGDVNSYPFVPATDFGGPDVQPPIVGLAAVGRGGTGLFVGDYAVAFARAHDIEIWRLDAMGRRRPGALILPSRQGNLGGVSAIDTNRGLVLTYADYGSSTATGSRWLVNAACY